MAERGQDDSVDGGSARCYTTQSNATDQANIVAHSDQSILMRPIYETQKDRDGEQRLAHRVASAWGLEAKANPKMYPIDYTFVSGSQVRGFGEIKIRTHPYGRFQTYILSAHKVSDAKNLADTTGKKVLLIVQWSCGSIGTLDLSEPPDSVGWGGRADRADSQDMEPVCHYRIERFSLR